MSHSAASHTTFYHRYQIVWVTKHRYKVLRGDGSTIEADANKDRKDAPQEIEKLWSREEQVQRLVADYLAKLANTDRLAPSGPKKRSPKIPVRD